MTFFSMLGADAGVRDILRMNRPAGRALIAFHEAVMRQPSSLDIGERELIAAIVSGLNRCGYCYGVHSRVAAAFELDESVLAAMVENLHPRRFPNGFARSCDSHASSR
jgi:AhpD family alkylhydroperoxidase